MTQIVEQLAQDVRHAIRALRRGRGATLMAVLAIALGIGANAAIFAVAHAYLLRVWQVRQPADLAFVRARGADNEQIGDFPWRVVERLRDPTRSLSGLAAFDGSTVTVVVDGQPEIVYADFVTGDYFSLLGLRTIAGRPLTPEDDQPGRPAVAVISHAWWTQHFGADPRVIGKSIALGDLVCTIVGVTVPDYFGRQTAGTAFPLTLPMTWHARLGLKDHLTFGLLGRLAPGTTPEAARTELDIRYQRVVGELSAADAEGYTGTHLELQPATRGDFDNARFAREVWILQVVAGLVLLLATLNVASLQLARGMGRHRELATRLALGATRARLVRQLLAESLVVATAGGCLGLLLASWGADALLALTLGHHTLDIAVTETPILAFTLGLVLLAGVLCGIAPALRLTRTDQTSRMSTSLRTRGGDRPARAGSSLMILQVALSIVLLIPAGLLVRTVRQLASVDLGFDASHIIAMSIYPSLSGYEGARELALYDRLREDLQTMPGIEAAGFSRYSILRRSRTRGLTVHADRDIVDPDASFVVDAAGPGFFAAMGLRLVSGREIARADTPQSTRVVVINQALADRYFAAGTAVGRSLEIEGLRREIVGVVSNMRFELRDEHAAPAAYIAYTQAPPDMLGQMWLKIRTRGEPTALIPAIRREIQRVAPTIVPAWADSADAIITATSHAEASLATLVGASGVLALFLAVVGLYGTMTQAVARRTREIGVRMALGAQSRQVTGMVLGQVVRLVIAGIAIGVPCAWAGAHLVSSFLFGVGPANPLTTAVCCAAVAGVSALAGFVPARRAAHIDPLIALQRD